MKFILMIVISLNIFALEILLPKAPPSLPIIRSASNMDNIKLNYYTDVVVEVVPNIVRNRDYLYVIPVNLGAKLYERNQDLQLIGVLSEGMLSIISKEKYSSIDELDRKTILIGGQGSSPDVISRYIFTKKNIRPNINYRSSQEVARLMISGRGDIAVLPEPLASLALVRNQELNRAFNLKDTWKEINNFDSIPQVGIFASRSLIENNIEVIEEFIKNYEESLYWIETNLDEAGSFALEALDLTMPQDAIIEAIKNMNLVFKRGALVREEVENYLMSLKEIDEEIIKYLPGDDFYKE